MKRAFTLVELVIVMMIGAVLLTITVPAFGNVLTQRSLSGARDGLVSLGSTARAEALERGATVWLVLDPEAEEARVVQENGRVLAVRSLRTPELAADLHVPGGTVSLCYGPRGHVRLDCGDGSRLPLVVELRHRDHAAAAEVDVLGRWEAR